MKDIVKDIAEEGEISYLVETKRGAYVLLELEAYLELKNTLKELTGQTRMDKINRDIALLTLDKQEELWEEKEFDELVERLYIEPIEENRD